ncbi:MAG: hypothetical protein R2759_09000 [Bacteroidales bacterium]
MKQLLFILLIFQSLLGFAQKWDHLIGFPNVEDGFLELLESYDNGYLLMGASEFYSYNWLIKTNINGELIWSKSIIHNTLTLGTTEKFRRIVPVKLQLPDVLASLMRNSGHPLQN